MGLSKPGTPPQTKTDIQTEGNEPMSLDRRRKETNPRKQLEKKTVRENSARKTKSEATNELRIQRKPLKHQVMGRPRTRERKFSQMFFKNFFFRICFL